MYRGDADFGRLLRLLDGYPLPIEVVLANLARQTPAEVLAALEEGLAEIDTAIGQGPPTRTSWSSRRRGSLLRCIDYSHSNLSPEAQGLLLCLAPFTGVVKSQFLGQYTALPARAACPGEPALRPVGRGAAGSRRLGPGRRARGLRLPAPAAHLPLLPAQPARTSLEVRVAPPSRPPSGSITTAWAA